MIKQSKQDKTYSRTAEDLERKYNLGRLAQGSSSSTDNEKLSKVIQELSEHKEISNNMFRSIDTLVKNNQQEIKTHSEDESVHITSTEKDNLRTAHEHIQLKNGNPHNVTKKDIGLENVENTSDDNKPVSKLQQSAIDDAITVAKTYTNEKIAGCAVGFSYEEENEALALVSGVGVSVISYDDLEDENQNYDLQAEIDIVSALANANKVALEVNASAIKTIQAEVEKILERVTAIEEWKDDFAEATSQDINDLFD